VSEAAVVGYPHDIKGQGIYAYVTLLSGEPPSAELHKTIVIWGTQGDWADSNADLIQFAPGLPKTWSGKSCAASCGRLPKMSLARSATADPTVVEDLICQPEVR
jgi:acetyl-CoA synthetase